MKKTVVFVFVVLSSAILQAQDITGSWNGVLKVQGVSLRLVLHVDDTNEGLKGALDSPDQGATGIALSALDYTDPVLTFEIERLGVAYSGEWKETETIEGTFTQMGQSLPLTFSRGALEAPKRPQEPAEPYPYHVEEVRFQNTRDGIELAGTLTLPEEIERPPVVLLISGSGPQDRNETVFGHKPFLVLADYLTRNGIAVLRYDDRGTAQSTGNHATATSEDLSGDVVSAVAFLKGRDDISTSKIGLVGHSEGGLLAPMVAAKSDDVAYMVLLAGPGIPGYDILMLQTRLIQEASGITGEQLEQNIDALEGALKLIRDADDPSVVPGSLETYFRQVLANRPEMVPEGQEIETLVSTQVKALGTPWMHYFISYDPGPALHKVRCPVLALNGERDLQVPPAENLEAIKKHLLEGGNTLVTVKMLPGLNHLFQQSETGSPSEYGTLEETFSPTALKEISSWIQEQVN